MSIENPQAYPSMNPAFDGNWQTLREFAGMTLRDHFAGCALAILPTPAPHEKGDPMIPGKIAMAAYAIADAMLAERIVVRS